MADLVNIADVVDTANALEIVTIAGAIEATAQSQDPLLPDGAHRSDGQSAAKENSLAKAAAAIAKLKFVTRCADVLSGLLLYSDVLSDLAFMINMFETNHTVWGTLSAYFIILQFSASFAGVVLYTSRVASAPAVSAVLVFGFPLAPILLDALTLLEPLGALSLVTHLVGESAIVEQLRLGLPSYKATRTLLETTVEGLPQSLLMLYVFLHVRFIDTAAAAGTTQISMSVLLFSLTLSLLNLAKSWVLAYLTARKLGLSLWDYVMQQVQMGKGLPLDAIQADAISTLDLRGQYLGEQQAKVLGKLFESNDSITHLDISSDAFADHDGACYALGAGLVNCGDQRCQLEVVKCDAFELGPQTSELDLKRKLKGQPGAVSLLAGAMKFNSALTSIDVEGNDLNEAAALGIVRAVKSRDKMTSLGLAGCKIGPTGAKEIAEYVKGSSALTKLNVRQNNLGEGKQALRDAVQGRDFELLV